MPLRGDRWEVARKRGRNHAWDVHAFQRPLSSHHGNSSRRGQGDVLRTHFSCGSGVGWEPHGGSSAAADALAPFRCVLRSQVVGAIPSESERRGGRDAQPRGRSDAARVKSLATPEKVDHQPPTEMTALPNCANAF